MEVSLFDLMSMSKDGLREMLAHVILPGLKTGKEAEMVCFPPVFPSARIWFRDQRLIYELFLCNFDQRRGLQTLRRSRPSNSSFYHPRKNAALSPADSQIENASPLSRRISEKRKGKYQAIRSVYTYTLRSSQVFVNSFLSRIKSSFDWANPFHDMKLR